LINDNESTRERPVAFNALVRGKVQGVGFRYSAVREAKRLEINGWVRNSRDGNVEVWAEGSPERLSVFLQWLHNGPQYSRVDSVRKEDMEPKGNMDFIVKH